MKDADPARFQELQRPVLCFLATSREPVAVLQIAEWSALQPGDVKHVIAQWREFLNEDPQTRPPHDQIAQKALAKVAGFLDT
jgi:hypothetical protein